MELTAVLTPAEEGRYVALNPEAGTTIQGGTVEEAIASLTEATALYLSKFPLVPPGIRWSPCSAFPNMPKLPHVSGVEGCEGSPVRQPFISGVAQTAASFQCTAESSFGTLAGVLRQADISQDEFIAAL